MALYEDDEFERSFEEPPAPRSGPRRKDGGADSWDVDAVDDRHENVPDDHATVRCTQCKKLIFDDVPRCPYCKFMQLEADRHKKPLWFWATVVFCVLATVGFGTLVFLFKISLHLR